MKRFLIKIQNFLKTPAFNSLLGFLIVFAAFFCIELVVYCVVKPDDFTGFAFGFLWSALLTGIVLFLPKLAGRIVFGLLYFPLLLWAIAQTGYYQVFGNLMWVSTTSLAGEGTTFLGDVLSNFSSFWWFSSILLLGIGVAVIWLFPQPPSGWRQRIPCLICSGVCMIALCFLPELIFLRDKKIWGADSDYNASASYRMTYNTMYSTNEVYSITGIYQLLARDIWVNELYPLTPGYKSNQTSQTNEIDAFFSKRSDTDVNEMTGTFSGKNVVLVMMESMDDWMITPEDTPTLVRLMAEGVNFTNFYTPGYGSARTLNSEFCMNTGIYLPTTGSLVFDYIANSFDQSFAAQLNNIGYDSRVFHYNNASYYSRNELEPAMGYAEYISYSDYTSDLKELCDDQYLFDQEEISNIFFREGQTFNTIITRSAHLGYTYNEIIGYYALQEYPEYKELYDSEEEICARVKAKLVDEMFARLLAELEARGQLENTVIIGITDHYTYGYKNMDELYSHSGVYSDLLLEKVPCFIWSADGPSMQVDKTLSTADFLPTMLNLLGIDSPYQYLGQDAFDPNYQGYALFPDGSWITEGVAYQDGKILMNESGRVVSQDEINAMNALSREFIAVSNLLLSCDYYKNTPD